MISLIQLKNLTQDQIQTEDYVIFGGTFDPFHKGHLSVVFLLQKFFHKIIIAPTSQNPWKAEKATDITLRREFISLILKSEGLKLNDQTLILSQINYQYAEELVTYYRKKYKGELFWAVGEDVAAEIKNWQNWDQLGVTTIIVPIEIEIHSTEIRSGKQPIHPAISKVVKKHALYQ